MSSAANRGVPADCYGQKHPIETPELIAQKLQEMRAELQKLLHPPPHGRHHDVASTEAARQALEKYPHLHTDDFQLMFLRADVFNADLAAKRYIHFWEKRVKIFGAERAFQPITVQSLEEKEMVALQIGYLNVVTLKGGDDTHRGRAILYLVSRCQDRTQYERHHMIRAVYYVAMALLAEHEQVQKKGVIVMVNTQGAKAANADSKMLKELISMIKGAAPLRVSAFHIVNMPPIGYALLKVVKLLLGDRLGRRLLPHDGSPEEILHRLETKYGMDRNDLPCEVGGKQPVDMKAWVAARRARGL